MLRFVLEAKVKCLTIKRKFVFLLNIFFVIPVVNANGGEFGFYASVLTFSKCMKDTWGTLCLPFDLIITGKEDFSLYFFELSNAGGFVLSPYEVGHVVTAGTPCVIKRGNTEKIVISSQNSFVDFGRKRDICTAEWTACGTFLGTNIDKGIVYYVANNQVLRKDIDMSLSISPFSAWFETKCDYSNVVFVEKDQNEFVRNDDYIFPSSPSFSVYDVTGILIPSVRKGMNIVRNTAGIVKKVFVR